MSEYTAGSFSYKPIQISVTNAQPGANIQINLAVDQGGSGQVSWSSGNPANQQTGITLTSLTGSLPLASCSITNNALTFQTSASGGGSGALQFEFDAFLAGSSDLQYFTLATVSDPSIVVKANFDTSGWVVVNARPTPMNWKV